MNLAELKAKAEAATPGLGFAAGPHGQTLFTWLSTMVDEANGEEVQSIVVAMTLPEADAAFIAAANPKTVLALVKVAEAVRGLAYTLMIDVDDQRMWETRMFAALEELEGME